MSNATLIETTLETGSYGMSRAALRDVAPSVFADRPSQKLSDRYAFVPTIEVVDMLRENGFVPTFASQSLARDHGKALVAKHLLRFRHVDFYTTEKRLGQEVPELVMINSHDGTSNYEFALGIFRLICLNGCVIQSADFGSVKVRHYGGDKFYHDIIDASTQLSETAPTVMKQIEHWKGLQLTDARKNSFASLARELVPAKPIESAKDLLTPRRYGDDGSDLWSVMNRIQESLIRGGIDGRRSDGRRATTKPIKAVAENIRVNRALWSLANIYADLLN